MLLSLLLAACADEGPSGTTGDALPQDAQADAAAGPDGAGDAADTAADAGPSMDAAADALPLQDAADSAEMADSAEEADTKGEVDATPDIAADAAGDATVDTSDASPRWVPPEPGGCNGWLALCGRGYDQVSYATAHNAMSSEEAGWFFANQGWDVPHQLAVGVRGLMLDVHPDKGDLYLCHGTCLAGSQLLVDGLTEIRAFLDDNPREVVTIIFESYVPAADVAQRFDDADLAHYAHAHTPGTPWPTLDELIDAGERLVVFTDNAAGGPPWHMDVWDHAFETHYHYESVADLSCDPNRGDPASPLFILNHFLTNPIASTELAEQVNHNPLLWDRAVQCQTETGHLPNFVTLDFIDIGDLIPVVDALNQVP